MPQLVIVDSECANLNSIYKACLMASLQPVISGEQEEIAAAEAIIFPGVGSFAHAAALIERKKLAAALQKAALEGKPFLGICLGMQLLFDRSEERGSFGNTVEGLKLIPGEVKRFPAGLPVPHVGWNLVAPENAHPLFNGLEKGAYFYFTHSYYVQPGHRNYTLATSEYGFSFSAAVRKNNILGVQFHPEKSGPAGLRLLANFGKIIAEKR